MKLKKSNAVKNKLKIKIQNLIKKINNFYLIYLSIKYKLMI